MSKKKIARAIHEGKIVGLFQGRMEYGPRALGNRSILARATEREINTWLNKKLNRTEFMPFAPSVLEEEAQTIFPMWKKEHIASRFMTLTYHVKEEWVEKVPAVVHVDNTARPHVVRKEDNPFFHQVLLEYKKISGLPALINTSFNIHEEPIVCTPLDAIRAFIQGHIDILVMENYWVELSDNQQLIKEM